MPRGGSYDLLYLPVDSAKMTNRGYAFINFTCAENVERFVREFINRPWKELNRKNKAAVLYWAFVQGKDATLAHINTEVMNRRDNGEEVY
jgi:RNA recognition motif-containing protein